MKLTFNISDEHVEFLCKKFGYTPTILVNSGETVDGVSVMIEKPISQDDFLFNWYAGVIDSDALNQKRQEAQTALINQIPLIELNVPQEAKIPVVSAAEVAAASEAMVNPKKG